MTLGKLYKNTFTKNKFNKGLLHNFFICEEAHFDAVIGKESVLVMTLKEKKRVKK